jgi:hypothetical protein
MGPKRPPAKPSKPRKRSKHARATIKQRAREKALRLAQENENVSETASLDSGSNVHTDESSPLPFNINSNLAT